MTPASAHGIAAQSASGARPITANDIVQEARVAAWDTYQAEGNGMVATRLDGGRTALFAFRGSCKTTDWGTNSHIRLATLGTAPELFPWEVIAADAKVHEGFLARFRETLGAAGSGGLLDQVLKAENDSKVERIVFAGHSLGGAVALLAYLWARANAGRLHDKVECVTFGAPMIGDSKLSEEITRLEWGASITNIVTRHDIVPRILLAAWKGSKIAGLGALLVACKGMEKPGERRQELPAEQEGLSGLVYKVKRTCEKFATGVRGIVTGAGPLLGALQGDVVQLAKGFPDTSRYRPCGRFFFILGEKMALVEAPELSFRLLHLTMVQPGTMPDYSGTADYISEHVIYPRLPEFDVLRPANETTTAAQAVAESPDSFFILEGLARLDHYARKFFQKLDGEKELMDEEQGMRDALAVIEKYGDSTEERYQNFRYTWPRTADEISVEKARRKARDFWKKAQRYYSVAKLPHDFLTGDRLLQADYYRLLCEPIDIANYYRPWDDGFEAYVNASRKAVRFDEESGPYLKEFADPARNNRPPWYTWIEKAWKEEHPGMAMMSSVTHAKMEERLIERGAYRRHGLAPQEGWCLREGAILRIECANYQSRACHADFALG